MKRLSTFLLALLTSLLLFLTANVPVGAVCGGGTWRGYQKLPEVCETTVGRPCARGDEDCTCTGGYCDSRYVQAEERCSDYSDANCTTPAWECDNGVSCRVVPTATPAPAPTNTPIPVGPTYTPTPTPRNATPVPTRDPTPTTQPATPTPTGGFRGACAPLESSGTCGTAKVPGALGVGGCYSTPRIMRTDTGLLDPMNDTDPNTNQWLGGGTIDFGCSANWSEEDPPAGNERLKVDYYRGSSREGLCVRDGNISYDNGDIRKGGVRNGDSHCYFLDSEIADLNGITVVTYPQCAGYDDASDVGCVYGKTITKKDIKGRVIDRGASVGGTIVGASDVTVRISRLWPQAWPTNRDAVVEYKDVETDANGFYQIDDWLFTGEYYRLEVITAGSNYVNPGTVAWNNVTAANGTLISNTKQYLDPWPSPNTTVGSYYYNYQKMGSSDCSQQQGTDPADRCWFAVDDNYMRVSGRVVIENVRSNNANFTPVAAIGVPVYVFSNGTYVTTYTNNNGEFSVDKFVEKGSAYNIRVTNPNNGAYPTGYDSSRVIAWSHNNCSGPDSPGLTDECLIYIHAIEPTATIDAYCAPGYGLTIPSNSRAFTLNWTTGVGNTYTTVDGTNISQIGAWTHSMFSKSVSGSSTVFPAGFAVSGNPVTQLFPNVNYFFRFGNGRGHLYDPVNKAVPECGYTMFSAYLDGQLLTRYTVAGLLYQYTNNVPFASFTNDNRGTNYYDINSPTFAGIDNWKVEIPAMQNPYSGTRFGATVRIDENLPIELDTSRANPIEATPGGGSALTGQADSTNGDLMYGYQWPYWSSNSAGGAAHYLKIYLRTKPSVCNVTLSPDPATVNMGTTQTFTPTIINVQNGTVVGVEYPITGPQNSLGISNNSPYTMNFTNPTVPGVYTMRIDVKMRHSLTGNITTACSDTATITVPTPSCNVGMSMTSPIVQGPNPNTNPAVTYPSSSTITAGLSNIVGGTVSRVDFSQVSSSKLNLNPTSDTSNPYQSIATPNGAGTGDQQIRASVYFGNVPSSFNPVCTITTSGSIATGTGNPPPICVPNCAPTHQCGQHDQCGNNCNNTDAQAPAIPTYIVTSRLGSSLSGTQLEMKEIGDDVRVAITDPRTASNGPMTNYDIVIYNRNSFANADAAFAQCGGSNTQVHCAPNQAFTSSPMVYTYTPTAAINYQMTVAVRAHNSHCFGLTDRNNNPIPAPISAWNTNNVDLVADINNPVEINNDTTQCNSSGTPISSMAGLSAVVTDNGSITRNGIVDESNKRFVFDNLPFRPNGSWGSGYRITLTINNTIPGRTGGSEVYCGCTGPIGSESCIGKTAANDSIHYNPVNTTFKLMEIPTNIGSWWQVINGNAYSVNTMNSQIPQYDNNGASNFVGQIVGAFDKLVSGLSITSIDIKNTNTQGVPVSNLQISTNTSGNNSWTREADPQQFVGSGSRHADTLKTNYEYYAKKVDLATQGTAINTGTMENLPDNDPVEGDEDNMEIYYRSGDLTLDISSLGGEWQITNGRKVVFFVDGNVMIDDYDSIQQLISVETGSFFGIISSGTITFNARVGYQHFDLASAQPMVNIFGINTQPSYIGTDNQTNANVEGVFVADQLVFDTFGNAQADKKFIGAGTFFAVNNIELRRKYYFNNTAILSPAILSQRMNNYSPTEVFIYRPDFVINFPEPLMEASILWQEVNGP